MGRARKPSASALLPLALAVGAGRAQAQEPLLLRGASIDILVAEKFRVTESLRLAGTGPVLLSWRTTTCTTARVDRIDLVAGPEGVQPLRWADSAQGPWRFLLVQLPEHRDTTTLQVTLTGRAAGAAWELPVLVPRAPLRPAGNGNGAAITVRGAKGVRLPRAAQAGPGEFRIVMPALPSEVVVQPTEPTFCDRGARRGQLGDGGLTTRLALLALTMLLWIPLYFAWARRKEDA